MNPGLAAVLIPILVPLGLFTYLAVLRYYQNVERMAMIEKGLNPVIESEPKRRDPRGPGSSFWALKWSLVLIGVGLGLLLGNIIGAFLPDKFESDFKAGIIFGLIMVFGGGGLFISYMLEMAHKSRQKDPTDHQDIV